jgi:hypothetical protein
MRGMTDDKTECSSSIRICRGDIADRCKEIDAPLDQVGLFRNDGRHFVENRAPRPANERRANQGLIRATDHFLFDPDTFHPTKLPQAVKRNMSAIARMALNDQKCWNFAKTFIPYIPDC